MKKSILTLLIASTASFTFAFTSSASVVTNNNKQFELQTEAHTSIRLLDVIKKETAKPPRKKRRGSPYRSGTGGKKWGGKVGSCAKKRRR